MIARGLLQAGLRVVIASRKAEDLEAAAAELRQHGECEAVRAYLPTPEGAGALAETVRARFDALHILVNNSGATWGAPLEEFPPAGWDRVIRTNLEGIFNLTVGLLPAERPAPAVVGPRLLTRMSPRRSSTRTGTGSLSRLCDGLVRLRDRGGHERALPVEPGAVYEVVVEMWTRLSVPSPATGIRVEIASSAHPKSR
jgi:NAD(P)-dependent dehydrogenase (short-subunit alcohol dehydrogenase family)